MKIAEIIEACKKDCKGWGVIDETKTRDKVLYGPTDVECTGVVTTIYASIPVIKKAHELGANFIISHEACWWNHGDHTDWLANDKTFIAKKALLDEYGITVWRNHDYIHSGCNYNGNYVDGIFYGLAEELGWQQYVFENKAQPRYFEIPETPTTEVAQYMMEKMNLCGMKTLADTNGTTRRIMIPGHLIGGVDNQVLAEIEEKNIDTLMCMEITDFTVGIYMRDGAGVGRQKSVLVPGHFNTEEPGMKWWAEVYWPTKFPEIKATFVQAGDSYSYLLRK